MSAHATCCMPASVTACQYLKHVLFNVAGYTVLHHAVAGGNLEIVNTLLRTGHGQPDGDSNRKRITPLHVAAKHGRVVLLPLLMQAGYRAQAITPDGKYVTCSSSLHAWLLVAFTPDKELCRAIQIMYANKRVNSNS